MKLNRAELEFLSAWAREEKAVDPYRCWRTNSRQPTKRRE
jgi:hypothetical protein